MELTNSGQHTLKTLGTSIGEVKQIKTRKSITLSSLGEKRASFQIFLAIISVQSIRLERTFFDNTPEAGMTIFTR
jgi:hypothetical protein